MRYRSLLLLVTLGLLLSVLPTASPVRAAEPDMIYGSLTYSENGPGAGTDGIATSLLLASVAGPVALARLESSLGPVLSLMMAAGATSGNPSMSSVSNLANSMVPADLAGMLPLSAQYQARLEFALKAGADGVYALDSGTLTWTIRNSAELQGEGTYMTDRFSGGGSAALDPAGDVIRLEFAPDGRQGTYDLTVDVEHAAPTSGESTWSALDGAFVLVEKVAGGVHTLSGESFGEEIPPETTDTDSTHVVYYTHSGPLSELTYTETYRNLMDAQVLVNYAIGADCSARIVTPTENQALTLETCFHCSIDTHLEASVQPESEARSGIWSLPEFGGRAATYDPASAQGAEVHVWYEGPAPAENSRYGPMDIRFSFRGGDSLCSDPAPRQVRVFFPRGSYSNPAPTGDIPNWFYYWKQTAAGQGHGGSLVYDTACPAGWGGYFNGYTVQGDDQQVYICDLSSLGFRFTSRVTGTTWEGIDVFGAVVLHEWTHLQDFAEWWPSGYGTWTAEGWHPEMADLDQDQVPDAREAGYGLSSLVMDTLGLAQRDCEYHPYQVMETWATSSADREDWAMPGKQSGS